MATSRSASHDKAINSRQPRRAYTTTGFYRQPWGFTNSALALESYLSSKLRRRASCVLRAFSCALCRPGHPGPSLVLPLGPVWQLEKKKPRWPRRGSSPLRSQKLVSFHQWRPRFEAVEDRWLNVEISRPTPRTFCGRGSIPHDHTRAGNLQGP